MRRRWMVVVALGVAVMLGGCGTGGPGGGGGSGLQERSAGEILASAKEAYLAATSVQVRGTLVTDGSEMAIDLRLREGGDAQVTVTTGGIRMEMIRLGDQAWIRSPDAWAQAGPEIAAAIGERWVLVTPESGVSQLISATDQVADMDTFGTELLSAASQAEKVEGETVGGVPTVGLRDHKGATVHIAADGAPLPLLITPPADQDQSKRLEFSGYDQDPGIKAPENPIEDIDGFVASTLAG